jgi:hypothetical protein
MAASIMPVQASKTRPNFTNHLHMIAICSIRSIYSIAVIRRVSHDSGKMEPNGKRTIQVNVRLSAEDFTLMQKAANALWPDAVLTNSGVLLGLARIAARDAVKSTAATKPKRS